MGNARSKKYGVDAKNPMRRLAKKLGIKTREDDLTRNQQRSEAFIRKWNRSSRRRYHTNAVTDRYAQSKTAWPVPLVESLFLPEYTIKGEEDLDDFEVLDVIARGAYGNVLKVRREDDKRLYAVKVLTKSQVIIEGAVKQSKDEATIQNMLGHHPFMVKAHWYWQSRKFLYIVSDYVPNGELFQLWKYHGAFNEQLVKVYVAEMALAIDFLHNAGVIYRDIKMENILLDNHGHLKVIDFGLAKWLKKGQRTRTICGTLQYIAPEILSLQPYGHTADWWSLGILMYVLLFGEYPVRGAKNHKEMAAMMHACDYDIPNGVSPQCTAVLEKLLMKDVGYRITGCGELQRMPWFRDLDFQAIQDKRVCPQDYYDDDERFPTEEYMHSQAQTRKPEKDIRHFTGSQDTVLSADW